MGAKGENIRINLKFQVNSDDFAQVACNVLPFRSRGLLQKNYIATKVNSNQPSVLGTPLFSL
jgi:hypothetical protein